MKVLVVSLAHLPLLTRELAHVERHLSLLSAPDNLVNEPLAAGLQGNGF